LFSLLTYFLEKEGKESKGEPYINFISKEIDKCREAI